MDNLRSTFVLVLGNWLIFYKYIVPFVHHFNINFHRFHVKHFTSCGFQTLVEDIICPPVRNKNLWKHLEELFVLTGTFEFHSIYPGHLKKTNLDSWWIDFPCTFFKMTQWARSSFLSKVMSFLIQHQLTLFWFQPKWQHFWKKWGLCNCLPKMNEI